MKKANHKSGIIIHKLILLLLISSPAFAQKKNPNPDPIREGYKMEVYEFIFSGGEVKTGGTTLDNVIRFSGFLNSQTQSHYNFSNHFGMFTGFGIRNIGLINKYGGFPDGSFTIKQRSYSLGIPLALKFGGLQNGNYLALGAEMEWMFFYKRKLFYNGNFSKTTQWWNTDVNPFAPSVFADLRFHNGTFFRFRYYLNDFLKNRETDFYLPGSGTLVNYKPDKSTMWSVSIGTAFKIKKKHKLTKDDV